MKKISLIFLFCFSFTSNMAQTTEVLVLFHSENGGTYKLAQSIAKGIEKQEGVKAVLKRIPSSKNDKKFTEIPIATVEELTNYSGIAFGSPVHFGNASPDMRLFLDGTLQLWADRKLEGIPATVFMSAGSGAGNEVAILSFWNTLAMHGMLLVPTGSMGKDTMDKTIPQGNTIFGTTSLASMPGSERPSESEKKCAEQQGEALAKVAKALNKTNRTSSKPIEQTKLGTTNNPETQLSNLGITLPTVPLPAGNYKPFSKAKGLVYINQVALKEGKIIYPGTIEKDITEAQTNEAVKQTMLNIISVLKVATHGDLSKVKQCVQLTGIFNAPPAYTQHAKLMNTASDLVVAIFGEKGKHARATFGATSIPLNSSVEIQAIFEIEE
jgi:NAD(P)H dehydrogenase (quinone)